METENGICTGKEGHFIYFFNKSLFYRVKIFRFFLFLVLKYSHPPESYESTDTKVFKKFD